MNQIPCNPLPTNGLPADFKDAVFEVQANIKAPIEIAVASALGALSLVCQDQFYVRRPIGLESPCSLFLITIADSGERKTTCDKLFNQPIREMELKAEQAEVSERQIYDADLAAWNIKLKALDQRLSKSRKTTDQHADTTPSEFREHVAIKPKPPKIRSLILRDVTPEAIAWHLHTVTASAGLMSDEGGQILNGRAADQLPLLNVLWDGGDLKVNRKDSESFCVRNAHLTTGIMVQRNIFSTFLKGKGVDARSNGFLARNLICEPASTQGYRQINSIEVATFPKVEVFQRRLSDLLEQGYAANQEEGSKPTTLHFCDDAKVLWVDFANYIERNLNPGGFYCQVRDAASKTAENVARVAALFHVFQGRTGDIQRDTVDQAIQICEWYLREFVRIFCPPPPIPQEQLDAVTLDAWLRNHFNQGGSSLFKRNVLLQLGPHQLRSKVRLNPAIELLCHAGKIRLIQEPQSRAWFVELYPHSYPYTIQ